MSPQYTPHAVAVTLALQVLGEAFRKDTHTIRVQMPVALGSESEPEPDLVVAEGRARTFLAAHPRTAVLVVEVADTSLANDRSMKASLYASAGVPDYWIVNLVDQQVEVLRRPVSDASQPFGYCYEETVTLAPGDTVSPLAAPHTKVRVNDLLPYSE